MARMERVKGVDTLFLSGETPGWHMHVGAAMLLSPALDWDTFRATVGERLHLAPQARWRLQSMPLGLEAPVFVDDDDFDLDRHLRRTTLDAPGGAAELGAVVGTIAQAKLPHDRPLWELWFVDGLADGQVAVVTKMHHALIDGVSGVDLSTVWLDLSPEPTVVTPGPHRRAGSRPGPVPLLFEEAKTVTARQWRAARFLPQIGRQAVTAARHVVRGTHAGLPLVAPRTPINGRLSGSRRFAFGDLALSDVRRAKDRFGVKVNDVILAVVAGSLRAWLLDDGSLPRRPLVAEVPVSLRTDATRADLGTRVGTMFVSLATDVVDPYERLRAIAASAGDAKRLRGDLHASVSIADVMPPRLIGLAVRAYTGLGLERLLPPVFNTIVSSIPGAEIDLFMAGSRVTAIYPYGPLLYGSGLNITALSHGDRVDVGVLSCADLVPDPWPIADGMAKALAELV
jgi:diacylglycerol O-acyltransferase / wax synthase